MWTTQASRRVVETRRSGAVTQVSVVLSMRAPVRRPLGVAQGPRRRLVADTDRKRGVPSAVRGNSSSQTRVMPVFTPERKKPGTFRPPVIRPLNDSVGDCDLDAGQVGFDEI